MGSVLIGTVASRSRQSDRRQPVNQLSNDSELAESALDCKELQQESPSRNRTKFEPGSAKQSVNIGKIARPSDGRAKDVQQVIAEVSQTKPFLSSGNKLLKPSDLAICAFKNINAQPNSRISIDKSA